QDCGIPQLAASLLRPSEPPASERASRVSGGSLLQRFAKLPPLTREARSREARCHCRAPAVRLSFHSCLPTPRPADVLTVAALCQYTPSPKPRGCPRRSPSAWRVSLAPHAANPHSPTGCEIGPRPRAPGE